MNDKIIGKDDRVRITEGCDNYRPADNIGIVVRERSDGGLNVKLDQSGDIVRAAPDEVEHAPDDPIWERLLEFMVTAPGQFWPSDALEAGAMATQQFDGATDGDEPEPWDELEEEERQEWRGAFIAGFYVANLVVGRQSAEDDDELEALLDGLRKVAEVTMTGRVPEMADDES